MRLAAARAAPASVPNWNDASPHRSLLPMVRDRSIPGRDYTVTTVPFANPGDAVHSVDNLRRLLRASPVTTITGDQWSFLYSMDEGMSELYDLKSIGSSDSGDDDPPIDAETTAELVTRLKALPRSAVDTFLEQFRVQRVSDLRASDLEAARQLLGGLEARARRQAEPQRAEVDPFA